MLVDTLRECAKRASDFGVTVGIQNHHDCGVDHRTLLDLLEEINQPNCRACFDAWAPALQGEDYIMLRERDLHAVAAKRIEASTGLYL